MRVEVRCQKLDARSQTTRSVALSEAKGLWKRRFFAALRMTHWLDMVEVTNAGGWRRVRHEDGRMCA